MVTKITKKYISRCEKCREKHANSTQ